MLSKSDKQKLNHLRKEVEKEKKRLRITEPRFTIQMDVRTKKITLSYSIPVDGGVDDKNNRIIRKKQVRKYLKNIYVDDVEAIKNNIQNYSDEILLEIDKEYKTIGNDKDSLQHWLRIYTEGKYRRGNITLSPNTIRGDKQVIQMLIDWCVEQKKKDWLNIWKWAKDGRDMMMEYIKYKTEVGGVKKKWTDGGVNSNYRRIRAFFNYIGENLEGFPMNLLNRMSIARTKVVQKHSLQWRWI